jgi:hypothetical protein
VEADVPDETHASNALKIFTESVKIAAESMFAFTTGLGSIAEVFNNALGPAMRDFDANYTKAMDGYLGSIERLANDLNEKMPGAKGGQGDRLASAAGRVAETVGVPGGACQCRCCAGGNDIPSVDGTARVFNKGSAALNNAETTQAGSNDKKEDEVADYARSWSAKAAIAGSAVGEISSSLQNLYKATGSKNKAMFEAMKGFAIAETVIQTARGAMGAYASLSSIKMVGPALGAAAAGAVIAAGAARVAMISNARPGEAGASISADGSINPSAVGGGSPNAYPVTEKEAEPKPMQNVTVVIHNPLSQQNWAELVEREIIPAINDAAENRNVRLSVETA